MLVTKALFENMNSFGPLALRSAAEKNYRNIFKTT